MCVGTAVGVGVCVGCGVGVSVGNGVGVGVSVGNGVGVSVGKGVGVSVGNGVGVDVSVGSGVDVSAVPVRGSGVVVILTPRVMPGNGAVANASGISRSADSPLTATSRKAKMKTVRCSIRDAFLIPSCFTVMPASFLQPCKDCLCRGYLLLLSMSNFHTACFHYGRWAGTREG